MSAMINIHWKVRRRPRSRVSERSDGGAIDYAKGQAVMLVSPIGIGWENDADFSSSINEEMASRVSVGKKE